MSTLSALAQKHGITIPLRVTDCDKILTIVKIDNQQVPDGQGGRIAADVLTGQADNGTLYTVRLNPVTIGQLVRIFGPDTQIEGRRVLATTFAKDDKVYIAFAGAPARNTPTTPPTRLPGVSTDGAAPGKANPNGQPQLSESNKRLLAEIAARSN